MDIISIIAHVLVFIFGLAIVLATLSSAIQTFVLPRASVSRLTRLTFKVIRKIFDVVVKKLPTYKQRDHAMAFYAPVALFVLPGVWLLIVLAGYTCMFWAFGISDWAADLTTSGSSLFTLGVAQLPDLAKALLGFTDAAIGLSLLALLIAYLPTMYSAFSQREQAVTLLEIRAGSPPSPVTMMIRLNRIAPDKRWEILHQIWENWELWFVTLDETHTSLPALTFFRSPQPERSWITAAGTVLDAAALATSTLDIANDAQAQLCIRAGFVALRHVADYFRIPFDADPQPNDPISLSRAEFDAAYDEMAKNGVPLKPDRDQAWRDFAGWRVNYDSLLLDLAILMMAPDAPWLSIAARLHHAKAEHEHRHNRIYANQPEKMADR